MATSAAGITNAVANCLHCGYRWRFGWDETCPNCGKRRVDQAKPSKVVHKVSPGEDRLWRELQSATLPFEREYKFEPKRKWRVDFACVPLKFAVEVEGGTWSHGRHTRGAGFERDCEKYNRLSELGWVVLRYTTKQVMDGVALAGIERCLSERYEEAVRDKIEAAILRPVNPAGKGSDEQD